jgi:formate hydrogenlyase transcriptional activator
MSQFSSPPLDRLGCGVLGVGPSWELTFVNAWGGRAIAAEVRVGHPMAGVFRDGVRVIERIVTGLGGGGGGAGVGGGGGGGGGVVGGGPARSVLLGVEGTRGTGAFGVSGSGGGVPLWDVTAEGRIVAGRPDPDLVLTLVDASMRASSEAEASALRDRLLETERAHQRLRRIQEELVETGGPVVMVGGSAGLTRVREQVARVASSDTTVLIQGETGSGKELVARTIHAESRRAGAAFVAVNCAALPESLIESELFGHERGAFTGADRRRLGKFELADAGTLFLDEIAEMPLAAQAKLLRVLQESVIERVGGSESIKVDVRVVAATHRELARRVERGLFREDLFYRLNVFRIDVPPLRDRREDLRELVEFLHVQVAKRLARPVLPVSERSMRVVLAYRWPGNIRELANAVERATLLADGPELEIELPESPAPAGGLGADGALVGAGGGGGAGRGSALLPGARSGTAPNTQPRDVLLDLTMEQLQRLHIMHALESCRYRVFGDGGAAERLDMNPSTLLSRMDKYGIPRPRTARRETS